MSEAQQVGRSFVVQYYHTLKIATGEAHRYYDDNSIIGRPEADGSFSIATTFEGIKSKIQDFGSLKARIRSYDMQDSLSGGLLILVNGFNTIEDKTLQNSTQLFFLAPQARSGFVVLNDIFRYMKNASHHVPAQQATKTVLGEVAVLTEVSRAEKPFYLVGHPIGGDHVPFKAVAPKTVQEHAVVPTKKSEAQKAV